MPGQGWPGGRPPRGDELAEGALALCSGALG
jgi:hypothetical protein